MADYAKKKNDELASLCKERGLPHTGKKADLVKRLEEYDTKSGSADKPAIEDEIDWDDEPATETAKAATTQPAADAVAAGGVGVEVPNPQAVPNQVAAEDPSTTDDLTVAAAPEQAVEEVKEPEKDFSTGLAERTIDEEIEKRKARARKFGMPEDNDDIKALERAKRFGTADLPGLLNKALPTGHERKRGRDEGERGDGVRKRSRGPFRGRGRPGRGRGDRRERTPQGAAAGSGGYAKWMTDSDREAAERRKARFAGS
jgi:SAP domain-containing ribonucleoprotein